MQLCHGCAASATAAIGAPLPLRRATPSRLVLRQKLAGGLLGGRHATARVANRSAGTVPLWADLGGDLHLTVDPEKQFVKRGSFGVFGLYCCSKYSGCQHLTASSLATASRCSRSPLPSVKVSRVALETPHRCYTMPTGIARTPTRPSHRSHKLFSSQTRRSNSDSLPPPRRHKKRSDQYARRSAAHAAGKQEQSSAPHIDESSQRQTLNDGQDASRFLSEKGLTGDHANRSRAAEETQGASAAPETLFPSVAADGAIPGWGLEEVDASTGKTKLEELYERSLARIRDILEQPLPAMPQDGSVDPDVFVGFASYSYQLRDQYRAILARELQVPVRAVRLSVAWSGRFDVRRFGRVQKVCGVCLDRQVLFSVTQSEGASLNGERGPKAGDCKPNMRSREATSPSSTSALPLPKTVQDRIHALVSTINARKREDLLQMSLFQASLPIPEVEFALSRREHRLVYHLHEWIRRHVLQSAVVVVVYGAPPLPSNPPTRVTTASTSERSAPGAPCHSDIFSDSHIVTGDSANVKHAELNRLDEYTQWQRFCCKHTAVQKREVQDKWLRLLHRRRVVPSLISLTELATEAAVAVMRGELPQIGFRSEKSETGEVRHVGAAPEGSCEGYTAPPDASSMDASTSTTLLDVCLQEVVASIAAAAAASSPQPPLTVKEDGQMANSKDESTALLRHARDAILSQYASDSEVEGEARGPRFRPTSSAQKEASMRWVRLVYQALLLREAQGSADASISNRGSGYADVEQRAMRIFPHVSMPALFAHGTYAGGQEEVAYLQRNPAAMNALLLHPHEISYKKRFFSRMRNGHRRLRMEEESAAPNSING